MLTKLGQGSPGAAMQIISWLLPVWKREHFFAWDIWDRDICSSSWHMNWTLPQSVRLYQQTAKTVHASPPRDAEPCGWAQTSICPRNLKKQCSHSSETPKTHKILTLHQNIFFPRYDIVSFLSALCPWNHSQSSCLFLSTACPMLLLSVSSLACMDPYAFIRRCFTAFFQKTLFPDKTSHNYLETNKMWVFFSPW